jgi:GIY-YIG catalytic domain
VRNQFDNLRSNSKKFTPEEMIELSNKDVRKTCGIDNFAGIYIIHNVFRNNFYVGKSIEVYSRAYKHFVINPANNEERYKANMEFDLPEIYSDYRAGDLFEISLIPLENTTFSTLDDLEAYAISAYNASVENGGYNRTRGNVLNKVQFENEEQEQVANLILNKIKASELFLTLTNDKKRNKYTRILALELALPSDSKFFLLFPKKIKDFQKDLKGK